MRREIATHAVRRAVGDGFPLMLDPACQLRTWMGALAVGRACDEAGFFWFEDPYRDSGIAPEGHKRLRECLRRSSFAGTCVALKAKPLSCSRAAAT